MSLGKLQAKHFWCGLVLTAGVAAWILSEQSSIRAADEVVVSGTIYGWGGGDREGPLESVRVEVWHDGQVVANDEFGRSGDFSVKVPAGGGPSVLKFSKSGFTTGQLSCSSGRHKSGEICICLMTTAAAKKLWSSNGGSQFFPELR